MTPWSTSAASTSSVRRRRIGQTTSWLTSRATLTRCVTATTSSSSSPPSAHRCPAAGWSWGWLLRSASRRFCWPPIRVCSHTWSCAGWPAWPRAGRSCSPRSGRARIRIYRCASPGSTGTSCCSIFTRDGRSTGRAVPETVVAVSPAAIGSAALQKLASMGSVDFVVIDEQDRALTPSGASASTATVLWRRQVDRTGWLLHAVTELPHLQWLHSDVVGVEKYPLRELARRNVLLTNGRGTFDQPMAEWTVLAILAATRHFPEYVRASDAGRWSP